MPAHARWRLDLSYDGASFHGFAVQPNVRTVAGVLGEAIARTVRLATAPHITCAGRTDAGVHAAAQVVHVDLPVTFDGDLARAITRQLEPLVVVARAERVSDTFDARHDAIERRYRYLIWNAATPDSASASRAWHVSAPLDLRAMRAAADTFLGERDFRAFCRRVPNTSPDDPVKRRVSDVSLYVIPWQCGAGPIVSDGLAYRVLATPPPPTPFEEGRMVAFEVAANAFCHQMVRSMVGALTAVGRGQMGAATVLGLLESGSRDSAPQPAPPHGLCLVAVTYP